MSDGLLLLIVVVVAVGGILALASYLDKRSKTKGTLARTNPRVARPLAIVLGLFCAIVFVFELFNSVIIGLVWPSLAVALLAYGFLGDRFFRKSGRR